MKIKVAILLVFFAIVSINAEDNQIKRFSVFLKISDIATYLQKNLYGISFDSQYAFTKLFGIKADCSLFINKEKNIEMVTIGPQIDISNNYLEGLMLGFYPGFKIENDNGNILKLKMAIEAAYDKCLKCNIGIGGYANYDILENCIIVGIKLGYYF